MTDGWSGGRGGRPAWRRRPGGDPSRLAGWLAVAALVVALAGVAVVVDRSVGSVAADAPQREPVAGPTATGSVESLASQLDRVARTVAQVRGLPFDSVPEPVYLAREELAERAATLVDEYKPEKADVDRRILSLLGAVPADADLRALLSTALSQQVAGFYDPRTDELVVSAPGDGRRLGPLDEVTLAHELEHALADQVLGLPYADRDPAPGEEDAAFAAVALTEGDATLTMILYAEAALTPAERAGLVAEQAALTAELGDLTDLPHYLQRSLSFPYEEGLAFVSTLHDLDGFAAVDGAYRRPPGTTLEILVPAMYVHQQLAAADPRAVPAPGAPWEPRDTLALGAADLLFLFEAPGDDQARALDDPYAAAVMWRGGEVSLFAQGERSAIALALEGEAGLCAAVRAWYAAAFPSAVRTDTPDGGARFDAPDQDAVLACAGREVRLGIAPDLATAQALTA